MAKVDLKKACKSVEINGHEYVRADQVAISVSSEENLLLADLGDDDDGSIGMESLRGARVLLMCANYFYEGILVGLSCDEVILSDAGIVYETGPWSVASWKDRQTLPGPVGVKHHAIESFQQSPSPLV